MKRWAWILAGVVAIAAYRSFFIVDETEAVIVTTFYRPVREIAEPGPYLKWPFQGIIAYDRRIRLYELRPGEYLTKDKKNIVADPYVAWKIGEPGAFLRKVREPSVAERLLDDVVRSELNAALGRRDLADLLRVEEGGSGLPQVEADVTEACRARAAGDYGVDIVEIGIRRINYPRGRSQESVFALMRSEREREATKYRSEGEEKAARIRAEADAEAARIRAEAYRDAAKVRGEADHEAASIYSAAHAKDPAFYRFWRSLDAYRKFLDGKTTVILPGDSDLLQPLLRGPSGVPAPAREGAAP
ncbi:MAG: protease modulator HflC [Planctomycetes bacterium]|nr:protease modulator HflC [Planctomycetota bacterium]